MLKSNANQTSVNVENREVVIHRTLSAPRELVWEAWTQPEHLVHWWGPKGFTLTLQQYELKTGGHWKYIMHGPDGVDYPNHNVFIDVQKPERLVYSAGDGEVDSPGQFETTLTLMEEGNKTVLTMRMLFKTAEERDYVVREFGAVEGGNQTLDRLEQLLASLI
ncbi:SRPBCC family protein [Paenibacillus woosongensis]|uniref:ATPase n=1 Tax=Paenibacillus woosongensis TaxID=307580 RepID=A0A7X3CP75_9BACL|nr:SRPBCC family protein [Paenibacillus woosongensis]MUG45912.1 ATPase [Paenibacillus woosongensis]